MQTSTQTRKLLAFNCAVLEQAQGLVALVRDNDALDFSAVVGPHLRHVIEHYEAFVAQVGSRTVDYDARPRDRAVERDPALATRRLHRLSDALASIADDQLQNPLAIHLLGGLAGDEHFVTFSSAERELMFLASHAIHHYAQIKVQLESDGIDLNAALDADFGKAPSTVQHERGQ